MIGEENQSVIESKIPPPALAARIVAAKEAMATPRKMIAAPSVVVASTATESYGQKRTIPRFVFSNSLTLSALVGVVVFMRAYVAPVTSLVVK